MPFGLRVLAEHVVGKSSPIMGVALIGEEMPSLGEIMRRGQRVFKMIGRAAIIVMEESLAAEGKLGADVLRQRPAFAAFPRLKLAGGEQLRGLDVPAGLIQQSAQFHGQVVAPADEGADVFAVRASDSPVFRRAASKAGRVRKAGERREARR